MTTLKIFISWPVHARQNHEAVVIISDAPSNALLEVTLRQSQGKQVFWPPASKKVTTDVTGSAFTTFDVLLEGPTPCATLEASASDPMGAVASTARSIEVIE